MAEGPIWTDAEFHVEALLRKEFKVRDYGEGVMIAWDMMGRIFGHLYIQERRRNKQGEKYKPSRFQDRWTQKDKASQPKAKWRKVCYGPYSIEELYLRVHLRESIKAAADLEGDINLLTDQPNRRILLGRGDLSARYATPQDELKMVHTDHLSFTTQDLPAKARYAPLLEVENGSPLKRHGGQVVRLRSIGGRTIDTMMCDATFCEICTEQPEAIPNVGAFNNMPFVHLGRDCERGTDPLQHFYTFRGAAAGDVDGQMVVPLQKEEVDVKFEVEGEEFVARALACHPETCSVCQNFPN